MAVKLCDVRNCGKLGIHPHMYSSGEHCKFFTAYLCRNHYENHGMLKVGKDGTLIDLGKH